jgi:hypothetical protein
VVRVQPDLVDAVPIARVRSCLHKEEKPTKLRLTGPMPNRANANTGGSKPDIFFVELLMGRNLIPAWGGRGSCTTSGSMGCARCKGRTWARLPGGFLIRTGPFTGIESCLMLGYEAREKTLQIKFNNDAIVVGQQTLIIRL